MTDPAPTSGPAPITVDLETDGVTTGTYADWLDAAAGVLRKTGRWPTGTDGAAADGGAAAADGPDGAAAAGAAALGQLSRINADGIRVPALGRPGAVALLPEARRGRTTGGWDIRALVAETDPNRARTAVLGELEGGATSIMLQVGADGTRPRDLAAVLEPVLLDVAAVVLHDPSGTVITDAAAALAAVYADRRVTPAPGSSFGADPWAAGLRSGSATDDLSSQVSTVVDECVRAAATLGIGALVVDGTAAHEQGAGDALEIAWSLAVGVAALRAVTEALRKPDGPDSDTYSFTDTATASSPDPGTAADTDAPSIVLRAASLIGFRYAVTDEQFTSIAKLRAARVAWSRILELSGISDPAARVQLQHAVTSRPMMSRYDPWVNMLRGTVAGFAAGAGGAQAVSVLPFDTALGASDAFGRRIARNVSHLLIGESRMADVADPAGGAAAIEELTSSLADAAWTAFQRIESVGGAAAALADGSFATDCEAQRATRSELIATRRSALTGVSEFPNLDEELPQRRPGPQYDGYSWPAAYERLRDSPTSAPVFLATLGSAATHSIRSGFATNALAAVGIAVVSAGPTSSTEQVVAAYDSAVTEVVCLVGSDADCDARGPETVTALRAAGARYVLLAGKPSAALEPLVDDRIALGDDVPALGERLRTHLGVTHTPAANTAGTHAADTDTDGASR